MRFFFSFSFFFFFFVSLFIYFFLAMALLGNMYEGFGQVNERLFFGFSFLSSTSSVRTGAWIPCYFDIVEGWRLLVV